MSQQTAIEWTDLSWNPVHGCSVVSPGCAHCYAATLSLRYGQTKKPWTPGNAAENVILKPHKLREPLSGAKTWQGLGAAAAAAGKTEGKLVFVNSMSDLFHEAVPSTFIIDVFNVMREASQHTFQILTKRPERMANMLRSWPLREHWPNVWLGTSIENRRFVHRADWLRIVDPAVRFISAEPLLGPLLPKIAGSEEEPIAWWPDGRDTPCVPYDGLDLFGIDWLIVGGESGSKARPMDMEWVRDLRDACEALDVAFFVKQLGGARPGTRLEDLPEDLRIREFPVRQPSIEETGRDA